MNKRIIYCTGCKKDVEARLTNGAEIYPHRPDLKQIPFWICDTDKTYVGTHYKNAKGDKTIPMGVLATPEIKNARRQIHALLDPLWQIGHISRGQAYAFISNRLGYNYHSGEIRTIDEARKVYRIVQKLYGDLGLPV